MRRLLVLAILVAIAVGSGTYLFRSSGDDTPDARVAAGDEMDAVRSGTAPDDCQLPDGASTIADANLGFAWRTFKAIERADRGKDARTTTYSPYSAATALHMLANGADPDIDQQVLASMCLRNITLAEVNGGAAELRARLERGDEVAVANGIWPVAPFAPSPRMDTIVRDKFNGEIAQFEGPEQINSWIQDRTKGRITKIMDGLDLDGLVMVLANAITFDGTWAETFEEPRPGPFTIAKGTEAEVPMLRSERELDYAFSEEDPATAWLPEADLRKEAPASFHMTRIPYKGGRYAMVLVVPALKDGLDDVLTTLDPDTWRAMRGKLEPQAVSLAMPAIDLTEQHDLEEQLFALGLPKQTYNSLLEPRPDPETDPVYIMWIRQKTFLEVDEKGTKAAAATVIGAGISAGGPVGAPVQADHPYLLAIEEVETGELLFLSAIRDPRTPST